jgi:hypothetical protein
VTDRAILQPLFWALGPGHWSALYDAARLRRWARRRGRDDAPVRLALERAAAIERSAAATPSCPRVGACPPHPSSRSPGGTSPSAGTDRAPSALGCVDADSDRPGSPLSPRPGAPRSPQECDRVLRAAGGATSTPAPASAAGTLSPAAPAPSPPPNPGSGAATPSTWSSAKRAAWAERHARQLAAGLPAPWARTPHPSWATPTGRRHNRQLHVLGRALGLDHDGLWVWIWDRHHITPEEMPATQRLRVLADLRWAGRGLSEVA